MLEMELEVDMDMDTYLMDMNVEIPEGVRLCTS